MPKKNLTRDLTAAEAWLVRIMREFQFGRIENMQVRAGQPVLNRDMKVVRVVHLGGDGPRKKSVGSHEFELKRAVRDLFDRLANLGNATVLRLEFRHGLPFLLEIAAALDMDALARAHSRLESK